MVEHRIPENLNEALKLLYHGDYQVMAGGTDLMVQRRSLSDTPLDFPKNMVYCAHLQELRGIRKEAHRVEIGAMTPLEDLLCHPEVPSLLRRAIGEMASPAIRHVATLGGNIANASPAGDTLPVLYLLDAWAELRSLAGSRMILIRDLITGPRALKIHPEEMLTKIGIPEMHFSHETFVKVGGRQADAISKVSLAAAADIVEGKVSDLRIAFGAVAPTVVRDETLEGAWEGATLSELKVGVWRLLDMYVPLIRPIDDQRSGKHYRHQVALNLLRDFIESLSEPTSEPGR
ncbi:MAG TPA: FAD binding domain-containing protein [Candidatus Izemoplasmatales bacterium]|nr:FAD binding domain-containing protein [Candidatus Izemoplasmatales bacterium]